LDAEELELQKKLDV